MLHRLDLKLILALTIVVILVSSTYAYFHVRTQKQRLLDTMILGADQLSKSITAATWHAMLADHREDAYEIMRVIAEKQGIDRIRMFNREGRLMFSTSPEERGRLVDRRSEVCAPCHARQTLRETLTVSSRVRIGVSPAGHRSLGMVTPIYNEKACSQAACHAHPDPVRVLGVLDLALSLDPVEQETANVRFQVLLATAANILVISLLIVVFTRRFVATPIREMIEGAKAVSEMDLDRPIQIEHRSRELDALASSFNQMRERLRTAVDEINQFTQKLETKVTERTEQLKAAHQKLLHSDRLASLGQLSASVAHEINNPIAGVLNLSMLMQRILKDDGIPASRVPEFRKYLNQVTNETSRVGRIVSDLLSFSRRSKPQRAAAGLNKTIQSTLSLLSHKLKLNEVKVEERLDPALPSIWCDPSQIQQVVVNLVLNAAEAIQPKGGGTITITTRTLSGGAEVELTVEDTGEGISPKNLQKIFDPFFTTKPEGKGVGLGLAVLYGIIKAHDGDIEVSSTLGEGAKFVITLPVAPPEKTEPPEAAAPAAANLAK